MRIIYYNSPIWRYFLKHLDNNIECFPIIEPSGSNTLRLMTLLSYGGFKSRFAQSLYRQTIPYSYTTTLVLDCHNPTILYKIAKTQTNHQKLFLWFWNPLKVAMRHYNIKNTIYNIKCMGYQIFTFDSEDARIYNLEHKSQFGLNYAISQNPIYDVYFCGNDKGRINIINNFKKQCYRLNINAEIIVPEIDKRIVPFDQNVANAMKSRALLDIVQNGQNGLTLRPLEALLNDKKLITNDVNIKKYDFYNRQNVFIIGEDNINQLKDFIYSPILCVPQSIKEKYTFNNWINSWND